MKRSIDKTLAILKSNFDTNKHPHRPRGHGGGQFAPTTHAGITSYRSNENTPIRQVLNDGYAFGKQLASLPGVSNVSVKPGWGGWNGGREPSWGISYRGNGEALRLLAITGKKFNQDSVLVIKPSGHPAGQESMAFDMTFPKRLNETLRASVEKHLVSNGLGGWSWGKKGKGTILRAIAVPQWGGDVGVHQTAFQKLQLDLADLKPRTSSRKVSVMVMNNEGDNNYDSFINRKTR